MYIIGGKLHVNHSMELWLGVKSVWFMVPFSRARCLTLRIGMVSTLPGEKFYRQYFLVISLFPLF